ncbi:hypothetical protein CON15_19750 [Bacillus cereus]|uniref:Integrase n=1 Tax=Bacillus thuringiensis TaxID=1428 RepID=A0A9X6U4L9_BACTU|nr:MULTISPECIES: hypothetical protein [Bacillus cereus group]MDO6628646.1 hypothetical protein [Bacillus thuringiensis]MDO6659229.1 hypothetical protein [Bacillus thuringiensis]MDO6698811.1 hypothetical protein [Bacillus thuringiensis]MEB9467834.1 hypothetical protein [Bacillus cereus]MEC0031146.1 hypothetical protein [Bacillus cereus]
MTTISKGQREVNKEQYLEKYPNKMTKIYYKRVFDFALELEDEYNKDLFQFDLEQIKNVLMKFKTSGQAIEVYGRVISSYIKWAMETNLHTGTNPLENVGVAWFREIGIEPSSLYFSKHRIETIENDCVNAQDAIIIRLLFEGIEGKEAIEIRELKKDDILEDESCLNIGGNKIRVEEKTINLAIKAAKQKVYRKKNGSMEHRENINDYNELTDNKFIIRSSITQLRSFDECVNKAVIYRRLKMLSEVLGVENLSTKNLTRSGQIYMAMKIMQSKGQYTLTNDDYKRIALRFDINNFYSIKKYCTVESVKEIYGDFLEQGEVQ